MGAQLVFYKLVIYLMLLICLFTRVIQGAAYPSANKYNINKLQKYHGQASPKKQRKDFVRYIHGQGLRTLESKEKIEEKYLKKKLKEEKNITILRDELIKLHKDTVASYKLFLVLGMTGVGKSSLICRLGGCKFKYPKKYTDFVYTKARLTEYPEGCLKRDFPTIGHIDPETKGCKVRKLGLSSEKNIWD